MDQPHRKTPKSPHTYRMLRDRLLLKQLPRPERADGLLLPDQDQPGPGEARYEVLSIGPEVTETIRVGDVVLVVPFAGEKFDKFGKTRIVAEKEVLAVVLDVFG